jgi:hypothetical protein
VELNARSVAPATATGALGVQPLQPVKMRGVLPLLRATKVTLPPSATVHTPFAHAAAPSAP